MSLVNGRPSYPLMIVGVVLIGVGVLMLLAVGGISLPPLSLVEVEAAGVRIRIGDIPVETAAALWGGGFLILVGIICIAMASRR
jgi:hypothetical protein